MVRKLGGRDNPRGSLPGTAPSSVHPTSLQPAPPAHRVLAADTGLGTGLAPPQSSRTRSQGSRGLLPPAYLEEGRTQMPSASFLPRTGAQQGVCLRGHQEKDSRLVLQEKRHRLPVFFCPLPLPVSCSAPRQNKPVSHLPPSHTLKCKCLACATQPLPSFGLLSAVGSSHLSHHLPSKCF